MRRTLVMVLLLTTLTAPQAFAECEGLKGSDFTRCKYVQGQREIGALKSPPPIYTPRAANAPADGDRVSPAPSAAQREWEREKERNAAEQAASIAAERRPERQRIQAWAQERASRISAGQAQAEDLTETLDLNRMDLPCKERAALLRAHDESLEIAEHLLALGFLEEAAQCRMRVDAARMIQRLIRLGFSQSRALARCTEVAWNLAEQQSAADKVVSAVNDVYLRRWADCYGQGRTQLPLQAISKE